jgi:hypothetical protein
MLSQSGIDMPKWVIIVCGTIPPFCLTVVGILQGKNPNGTTKTPIQVNELNKEAVDTKPVKPV